MYQIISTLLPILQPHLDEIFAALSAGIVLIISTVARSWAQRLVAVKAATNAELAAAATGSVAPMGVFKKRQAVEAMRNAHPLIRPAERNLSKVVERAIPAARKAAAKVLEAEAAAATADTVPRLLKTPKPPKP